MILRKLMPYKPSRTFTAGGLNVIYLRDEDGRDWYEAQKEFSPETIKIAFTADGVVRQYSTDISALWPENMSVSELSLTDVNTESLNDGSWIFDGQILSQKPQDYIALAQSKKQELSNEAMIKIAPLQYALELEEATDVEIALLQEWKKYSVALNRLDISTAPDIAWPEEPTS